MRQRRGRFPFSVEHHRIIVASRIEARRKFQAAFQQCLRIRIALKAPGHLGEHAQCGDVGRIGLEMGAQQCFGHRQVVCDQSRRRFQQPRIRGGRLDLGRPRIGRAVHIARQIQLFGEHAPPVDRSGLELQRAPHRRDRLGRAARLAQGNGQFDVHGRRFRLLARERLEDAQRSPRLSGVPMSGSQNQAGIGMPGDGLQDLVRLLYSEPGVPLQQSCSMPQRNIHCPNGLRNAVQLNIQSIPVVRYQLI